MDCYLMTTRWSTWWLSDCLPHQVGADADFVLLDDELHVCATYLQGEQAWPLPEGTEPGPLVHQPWAYVATPQVRVPLSYSEFL